MIHYAILWSFDNLEKSMYRVAIIVNENETLHSVYANTEFIIKKALSKVYLNGEVDRMYSFEKGE